VADLASNIGWVRVHRFALESVLAQSIDSLDIPDEDLVDLFGGISLGPIEYDTALRFRSVRFTFQISPWMLIKGKFLIQLSDETCLLDQRYQSLFRLNRSLGSTIGTSSFSWLKTVDFHDKQS
jgi:hypothetical protein